jgi:hypothetical protein
MRVRQAFLWCLAGGYSVCAVFVDENAPNAYYLMTRSTRASSPGLRP